MERKWLIEVRNDKKMTQNTISEKVEISQQYYSKIENGERTPSTSLAKKIAKVLKFEWTRFYE